MTQRLLLLGGGHVHAFVLRAFAESPPAGVSLRLVTPYRMHTYSGMLPGLVAGHYAVADVQIDVGALARAAGCELIDGRVSGIDAARRRVTLEDGTSLDYDLASLNLGSLPNTAVPGSAEHALPAKPFERFLEGWSVLHDRAQREALSVALVGAGAAGVELAMAIAHRLSRTLHAHRVALYSDRPMFRGALARRVRDALVRHGVTLYEGQAVEAVAAGGTLVHAGKRVPYDAVLWTAGASPLPWLRTSGLENDAAGFVQVDDGLRSTSHPEVFAGGDCATLASQPHAKSGVFAVRHAAVIARNLRQALTGGVLERYVPQRRALALISCGARTAIADWAGWSAEGAWVWHWKDALDRRWIRSFAP